MNEQITALRRVRELAIKLSDQTITIARLLAILDRVEAEITGTTITAEQARDAGYRLPERPT